MIQVALIDDQTLVRQGIRSLLELTDDIRVIAEASDGDEALRIIRESKPDVVLLDVRMPKRTGIEVLATLRTTTLPPTIILTTFDDDNVVLDAIRNGAKGYLLKDCSLAQLTDAIRVVAGGGTLIQPALTERVIAKLGAAPTETTAPVASLTSREMQILRLLAGGYSNREIAHALGAAEGTVKNHLSNILAKLGVRDRTRAVLKAIEKGLI